MSSLPRAGTPKATTGHVIRDSSLGLVPETLPALLELQAAVWHRSSIGPALSEMLRLRNARTVNIERLALALVFFALIPAAINVDALYTIIAVDVLLWAMIAYETVFVYDERRYRIRHGLEVDIPGRG